MSVSLDKHFGIHAQALVVRGRRAQALASNLANADTPNYKARDFDFKTLLDNARVHQAVAVRRTHNAHLQGASSAAGAGNLLYRIPQQPSLDGNTVDAQVEQSQFAQNAVRYQASLHFLNSKITGLIRALREE